MQAMLRSQPWVRLFSLVLLLLLAACATQRVDWGARLGQMSHDEAVMELGPPDKEATLSDGTRVAEWLTHRSGSAGYVGYVGGYGRYHPYYGPAYYYDGHAVPDREYWLRLTFGPDDRLSDWLRVVR